MEDRYVYGDKLKKIRLHFGLNQENFAKMLDLKQGSYADIERDKTSLSAKTINMLIEKFNVDLNWLFRDSGSMFFGDVQANKEVGDNSKNVKIYKSNQNIDLEDFSKNGKAKVIQEYYVPNISGEHIGIIMEDNDMLPTIGEGDIIIMQWLENKEKVRNNHPYIIIADGKLLVKRIIIGSHKITLRSDNPFYDDIIIEKNDIKAVGNIVSIIRKGENI